jgi:hypothetical protein
METFNKIFEIIDENAEQIPNGLYLSLMNLLKDHHKEINENDTEKLNHQINILKGLVKEFCDDTHRLEEEKKDLIAELMYEKKKTNKLIKHIEINENTKVEFEGLDFMTYKKNFNKLN